MPSTPFIACVEDDPSVCEAIVKFLDALDLAAEAYSSAEEFLQSGRLEQVQCLITDVNLKGMSGLQLQDRLAAAGHAIPTIVITGFPDEGVRRRALDGGAICFLSKPVATEDLLACIRTALTLRNGKDMSP
jgi:FixJ family two-component response regulator